MGRGFRLWIMVLSNICPHHVEEITGKKKSQNELYSGQKVDV